MADILPNPTLQAGGGASESTANRKVHDAHASVLVHLKRLFGRHVGSASATHWSPDQITAFLAQQADSPLPTDHPLSIAAAKDGPGIDFSGFLGYMTSTDSAATGPPVMEDLSYPLASYFISSSHNTYLTGNQLSSEASVEAYKNVLIRGCRCIEVDVWDGDETDTEESSSDAEETQKKRVASAPKKAVTKKSTFGRIKDKIPDSLSSKLSKTSIGKKIDERDAAKQAAAKGNGGATETVPSKEIPPEFLPEPGVVEPRVLHGYTLTKEVSFRDVCLAVREYAFMVSDLPLIVSLEVHCSPEQQEMMVNIMKKIWNGMIAPPPADMSKLALPTPQELRNKIIIKVKYAPPGTAATSDEPDDPDDKLEPPAAVSKVEGKKETVVATQKLSKIIQSLSDMGYYARGVSFKSLTQPEATMPTHIFSLSENTVDDVHEKQPKQLFDHNLAYMMRTYPHGLRIGSSNLDPAPAWRRGIQVTALNWQNWDEGMMLNEGMFAGTMGYVLKPPGYRIKKVGEVPPPITHQILDLSLTIFAAQNLPMPPDTSKATSFRPYVKVEIHVEPSPNPVPTDPSSQPAQNSSTSEPEGEYKLRTKTQKGTEPDFGGELLVFSGIKEVVPRLTFVRFTVRDDEFGRDDLAAWACIRLDRLRNGLRFVHLMDMEGRLTNGALLVKVEKKLA